jgi:hypothetical protein
MAWIKTLMRDCKWLMDGNSMASLHSGPFIVSKYHIPDCDVQSLKCLACFCAKATSRTTKLKSSAVKPTKNNVLKRLHLVPGCCMSVDHYFSPKMGRLPHTFGRERIGYSCGTLFVDHASGKLFNFCQYLNNATETIQSKCRLESLAKQEGIKIHEFHTDNGIFAFKEFKDDCASMGQIYSFSGVGAHHQNGIAECNIKTVAQWPTCYI